MIMKDGDFMDMITGKIGAQKVYDKPVLCTGIFSQ